MYSSEIIQNEQGTGLGELGETEGTVESERTELEKTIIEEIVSPSEAITFLTQINNIKEAERPSTEEIAEYMRNVTNTTNTDPKGKDWEKDWGKDWGTDF